MAEITREELLARYKAGERDFSGLDFSGLDLSGIQDEEMLAQYDYAFLKADYALNRCIFRGANFSYVNFKGTCIAHCNFRSSILFGANLSCCSFSGANFTEADMREVTFDNGEGIGVIFENTNFTGAKGNFCHEGTLCLRNCIGRGGEFIELFNEETVARDYARDSHRRYIEKKYGMSLEEFERIRDAKKTKPDAEIPF
jgi:uncharacterized protein YjbI with pentapeptide repeats